MIFCEQCRCEVYRSEIGKHNGYQNSHQTTSRGEDGIGSNHYCTGPFVKYVTEKYAKAKASKARRKR